MSNIAGKAYAMNVITPINRWRALINRFIFWLAGTRIFQGKLLGLRTLSLIHYARWVLVESSDFPRLSATQPPENLKYTYMFFFSNFNGSWTQYVDSFSSAIPSGLDLIWFGNVKYPKSVPMQPFHSYITANQVWTNHYYNAYPMATANDVKAARKVRARLLEFIDRPEGESDQQFRDAYDRMLIDLQGDLSIMAPSPVVSLAAEAVEQRRDRELVLANV